MAQGLVANLNGQTNITVSFVDSFDSRIAGAASYFGGSFGHQFSNSGIKNKRYGIDSATNPFGGKTLGRKSGERQSGSQIEALQRPGSEGADTNPKLGKSGEMRAFEDGAWMRGKNLTEVDETDPLWEEIGAGLRLIYAAGVYGAMALAGQAICHFTGLDNAGGFNLCPDVAMQGLGYAVPPMMALLFILDDEVVKISPPARAIRDVEDEELMSFFVGMSPWQLMIMVTMASVAEEIFFRIAIQGGLAHVFLSDDKIAGPIDGIASLTGVFPFFAPFAHALAAVLTAALTGSILFITSPQDPTYVIAPVYRNSKSQRDLKKSFAAWYRRRQMRRIYSPLLDAFLALYLGFEWVQTGNILAPIITHTIYMVVSVGNRLRLIHEQRVKLRQRTQQFWEKETVISEFQSNSKQ